MRRVALGSSLRRVLLGSLATSVLAVAATPALAANERQINIPAGTLEQSLATLAAQTGDQLLFTPDLIAGRRAPALSGKLTTEEALRRLLAEQGIDARRTGPRILVLKPAKPRRTQASTEPAAPVPAPASSPFAIAGPAAPTVDRAASEPATAPTMLEAVEVTGTLIRGPTLSPSPLLVLDREAIDRTGHGTITGALSVLPQNFGGLNTEGTVATRADGQGSNSTYATSVNLRGLGPNATLVLVNGRRLGGSGISGDFADIGSLPAIAVSRIEVLLDGASATYGSDAVGGVVNVILRRDLEGGEVRVAAGTGASDSPREFQAGVVFGHRWPSGSVLLAYEAYQRDPLPARARAWTDSADLRPLGGTDRRITNAFPGNIIAVNPATGTSGPFFGIPPGQNGVGLTPSSFQPGVINRASGQNGLDVLPGQRRQGGYLAFHQDLTDRLEVSGDVRYGFRAARTAISPSVSTLTVSRANPFFVSPNGAASHQIQYSFSAELGNPIIRATAESATASLGGRLRLVDDWILDAYAGFAQEIDEARAGGVLNTAILAEALGNVADRPETAYSPARDGFFNPYTGVAANRTSVTSALGSGFTNNRVRSQVRSVNAQADGTLITLPAGPLKIAVGGGARRESFLRKGMSYTSTVAPAAQNTVDGQRSVAALYAEGRLPLLAAAEAGAPARLELSGAIRWERYSDFGETVDPKAGIAWALVDGVRLRGTWGTSFRAPSLNVLLNDQTISSLSVGNPSGSGQVLTLALQGGNPGLQPEQATTWTAGLDLNPSWAPRARLSVTWFDTDFKGRISRPVNENSQAALTDPRFAPFVQRISPATNAGDLARVNALLASPNATAAAGLNPPTSYVAIVDLRNVNTGELRIRGLDAQASYRLPAFGGDLTLNADATRLFDYKQALTPTSPSLDRVGLVTQPAKFRGRIGADWSRGVFSGGLSVNHVSAFRDTLGTRIDDQTTVDLRLRLKGDRGLFRDTSLTLSVRNLFNAAPPFYDNPTGFAYDPANADVIGRFVRIQLARTW